ncbi:MAG: hypothetical protein COA79_16230 [Planctomycetota bacterium]|nr:MAG: hypothetical protein COA79_16230 [Planctomycetota bacterium]
MLYGTYLSANGMRMQMKKQGVIANNLANANTVGFKRDLFSIQEMGTANQNTGRLSPWERNDKFDKYGGPQILSTRTSFEKGANVYTGGNLNFSIEGEGFFKVKDFKTDEVFYTRNGHFMVDKEGFLTMPNNGLHVLDNGDNQITVDNLNGSIAEVMNVVNFDDLTRLSKKEGNLFSVALDSNGERPVEIPATSKVLTGFLEGSNTNAINEMVSMIEAHRAYQANASNLKSQDENLGTLISISRI